MNQLLVSIDSPPGTSIRWRVPATIRGVDGDVVQEVLITTGGPPLPIPMFPGNYVVEAYLPSGEMLRRSAAIQPGQDATVQLLMKPSPHEWLRETARLAPANRLRSTLAMTNAIPQIVQTSADPVVNPFISLRDWIDKPRSFAAALPIISDETIARFDFSTGSFPFTPRGFLFTADTGSVSSAVALPLGWTKADFSGEADFEIVVNKTTGTISTTVQDPDFALVLGYLADGQTALASRALNEQALDLLAEKLMNPFAAAAGGYVLLQRALEGSETRVSWRSWIRNLTNWFPTLPDGFVIRGTLLLNDLRADGDPDLDSSQAAELCFRQAVNLGVPLFASGVRFLVNGLMALYSSSSPADPGLAWARKVGMHLDAHEAFTTLRSPKSR